MEEPLNKKVLLLPNFEFVSEVDEEFKCPICLDPFTDPIITSCCQNTFCRLCAKTPSEICPMCRGNMSPMQNAPRCVLNFLSKVEVKCLDCSVVLKRNDFDTHVKNVCPIDCPHGCEEKTTRGKIVEHEKVCNNLMGACQCEDIGCLFKGTRREVNEHQKNCSMLPMRPLLIRINEMEDKIKNLTEMVTKLNEKLNEKDNVVKVEKKEDKAKILFIRNTTITLYISEEDTLEELFKKINDVDSQAVRGRKINMQWNGKWFDESDNNLPLKKYNIEDGKSYLLRMSTQKSMIYDWNNHVYYNLNKGVD